MVETASRAQLAQWLRDGWRVAAAGVRVRPPVVTLAFVVVIASLWVRLEVGGQLPTARFVDGAFSARAVLEGRYSTLLTSTLLSRDIFMVISICISLLVTMGTYEVVAGHIRALSLAVFAAAVGPLSILGGLTLLHWLGSHWAEGRLETLDIGASAIVAASSGALAAIAKYRPLTIGLVLFLISGLFVHHQLADCEHLLIFPWGYLSGRLFGTAPVRQRRPVRVVAGYSTAWIVLLSFGLVACSHVLPPTKTFHSATGKPESVPRIIETKYPTPSMGGTRSVVVLLPAGYDSNTTQVYPVIEVLHGDPGAPLSMVSVGGVESAQSEPGVAPFIGIVPDGNDSTKPFSWWANIPGHDMGTAVTTDLRTWVARQYRTDGEWSFAGLSSGGFGAAYLPLISTQPVHAVCALSGYYDGHIPIAVKRGSKAEAAVSPDLHADAEPALVFVAYGASDGIAKKQSQRFIAALHDAGKHVDLQTYPGGHSWSVWRAAFKQCFQFVSPAPS